MTNENFLNDLTGKYLEYFTARNYDGNYKSTIRLAVRTFLSYMKEKESAGSVEEILSIDRAGLSLFENELSKGISGEKRELSPYTVRSYMKVVRRFLKDLAVRHGIPFTAANDRRFICREYMKGFPEGLRKTGLEYIEKRSKEGTPKNSMKKIRTGVEMFARYLYENCGLSEFIGMKKEDVKNYVKYLSELTPTATTKKGVLNEKLYCAASVNRYLHDLKPFLMWLSKRGLCSGLSNHVRLLRSEDRLSRNILSRKEIVKLLNVRAESPLEFMLKTICVLLYASGLRVGELTALKRDGIDFENKSVCIFETKTGKERTVPIGDVGAAYLKLYLENVRPFICKGPIDSETVFVSIYEGRKFCHETVNRYLKGVCQKAEIRKRISCHCFRHSYGTHLLENGAGIKTVSMLLGHADLMSTEKYTRLNPESLRLTLLKYHPRERLI